MTQGNRIAELVSSLRDAQETRLIVAIAGAPGSGKSTLADFIAAQLNADRPSHAAILPMDGYHYDDSLLSAMGRLARKGAPDTFDVMGLAWTLRRLRESDCQDVVVPIFDREIEIARAGARLIKKSASIIIVEGNYLLCNVEPWHHLQPFFDKTVMLNVSDSTLRQRLRERWIHYGLDEDGIRHKLEDNDIPNGHFVLSNSRASDWTLSSDHIQERYNT
ncbi:MAG: nucleoside triphosphate hydrolase [Rhodobacteraceae bacterium]|nr:nucleoside triphosphate hydrolase [Paracoccaceae bacterium]